MELAATRAQLLAVAERAVTEASRRGASQAEAGASLDEGLSVTVRLGEIESVERQRDRGLAVTVYKDGRKGSASTADFSSRSIEEVVDKALSIASFTAVDEFAGLADAALLARNPPDLDLYHPWEIDVDAAGALALDAENAARGADRRIANSEGATAAKNESLRVYANSLGFCDGYPSSSCSISASVVAADQGTLERDYWYSVSRDPRTLETPESVGQTAGRRAVARLGARQVTTRAVPVLFPPELARGLFGHWLAAIRGTSQYRRASFLLDAVGRAVFPENIDIDEDPLIPRALASAPFDAEGVKTRPRKLIEHGVLRGYLLSSYSARRLGLESTGNAGGAHNIIVRPTADEPRTLLERCPEAFVVGELLGQGVNTVTGDYSRGAAGFLLRAGELVHPVNEVTLAGNLREMFLGIRAVGSDVDTRGGVHTGSVLVEGLTLAGE